MDKGSENLVYLRQKFPRISEAQMKDGIFVGAQITQLFEDQDFSTTINSIERRARNTFEKSSETFLAMAKRKITVQLYRS